MTELKYLFVIDSTGVCSEEERKKVQRGLMDPEDRKPETIDFSGVLLNLETGSIESEFHEYVKPTELPTLTDHCKDTFGITQEQVDAAEALPVVLLKFDAWLKEQLDAKGLTLALSDDSDSSANCALAAYQHSDFQFCFSLECQRKEIPMPKYFECWIDLYMKYRKALYMSCSRTFRTSFDVGLFRSYSQNHSGLLDVKRTAEFAFRLTQAGLKFYRSDITDVPRSKHWNDLDYEKRFRETFNVSDSDDSDYSYYC